MIEVLSSLQHLAYGAAMAVMLAVVSDGAPPKGWTTNADLVRVIDGDTIVVEVRRTLKVRLKDCWAPERSHADGPASTANLKRLLGDGPVVLHVPVESGEVEDIWTFGRVLGTVWRADYPHRSVNEVQVAEGFATETSERNQ